jgi:hypothetical protein
MLFQNPAYRLARHKVFCFHCIRSFGRERSLIVERVRAGLRNARAKGKTLARPREVVDAGRITALRAQGFPCVRLPPGWGLVLPPCIVHLYPVPKLGKGILEHDRRVAVISGLGRRALFLTFPGVNLPLRVRGGAVWIV